MFVKNIKYFRSIAKWRLKKIIDVKAKFVKLIKLHLIFDSFIHSYIPKIITIYIKIENKGTGPVLPKNKHDRIKGIPTTLTNNFDFLDLSLIIKIT